MDSPPRGIEERLFLLLTRLYPRAFRRRYGAEILEFFRAERARPRYRGVVGAVRFWVHTLFDLTPVALRGRTDSIPSSTPMSIAEIPRHLRLAWRGIRRRPGFSFTVVATLALGMAASLTVFALVDAALLEALPFVQGDRLYFIQGTLADDRQDTRGASFQEIRVWRERVESFEALAAVNGTSLNLVTDDAVERLPAELVGPEYFEVMRGAALRGRLLGPGDHTAEGQDAVAVIREDLWERRFQRDPEIVGARIRLNDMPFTVVGVLPEEFEGIGVGNEVWVPVTMAPLIGQGIEGWGDRWLSAAARLADGVSPRAAQAELDAVAAELARERPGSNENRTGTMMPVREAYLGDAGDMLWVLLGASVFLLLIAAANVAGLMMVRVEEQESEHALCLALGARRRNVVLRVMVDSLLLTALGALGGWVAARIALGTVVASLPDGVLPGFMQPGLDATSLLFVVGLIALTSTAAGLVPALSGARGDLTGALREARVASSSRGRSGLTTQQLLVVVQVAIALVVLVGAGLMGRTVAEKLDVPPGFEATDMTVFRARVPGSYEDVEAVVGFVDAARRRLLELPGVLEATYGFDMPLRGRASASYIAVAEAPDENIRYYRHRVAPDFLDVMGIDLLRGRDFTEDDAAGAPEVVMISRSLAQRFFRGRDPVGETMILAPGFGDVPARIVGVVDTVRWRDLTTDLSGGGDDPDVYFPFAQQPTRTVEFGLRMQPGADAELLPLVREAIRDVDPEAPVFFLSDMESTLARQTAGDRLTLAILAAFGVAALLLAGVGTYGALAHAVSCRSREIAIRLAVGAPEGDVRRTVVGQGMKLAAIGGAVGLLISLGLTRLLSRFLFGVTSTDPMTYAGVVLVLAAVALTSTWIPALRATRVDPQTALRVE